MQTTIAQRMHDITSFHVMALLAQARQLEAQGHDVVHMEIGEPDFDSPAPVIEAGVAALRQGLTHYTSALGIWELRLKIAEYINERYGVAVNPQRVVVTPGSSGALQLVMSVLVNPGEEVLLTDPGYPCNRNFVRLVEGVAVSLRVDAENRYQPTLSQIQRQWSENTKALLLASPANPTGTTIATPTLQDILSFTQEKGGYLLMDEIYHGLEYTDTPLPSALNFSDRCFVINSFSKFFGMTGWRLGWLVAPEEFLPAIDRLAQNVFLAPSTPAQYAALACFTPATRHIVEERRQIFRQRRDYLYKKLINIGFIINEKPDGAFYLYADCSRFSTDSFGWCEQLLAQQHVAVTPGIDFGRYRPNTHVRFAYTTDLARLEVGIQRIKAFLS